MVSVNQLYFSLQQEIQNFINQELELNNDISNCYLCVLISSTNKIYTGSCCLCENGVFEYPELIAFKNFKAEEPDSSVQALAVFQVWDKQLVLPQKENLQIILQANSLNQMCYLFHSHGYCTLDVLTHDKSSESFETDTNKELPFTIGWLNSQTSATDSCSFEVLCNIASNLVLQNVGQPIAFEDSQIEDSGTDKLSEKFEKEFYNMAKESADLSVLKGDVSENNIQNDSLDKFEGEPHVKSKDESKAEPKGEPKVELKGEPKDESKGEPKGEPKDEPKVESKAEPKAEPKAELIIQSADELQFEFCLNSENSSENKQTFPICNREVADKSLVNKNNLERSNEMPVNNNDELQKLMSGFGSDSDVESEGFNKVYDATPSTATVLFPNKPSSDAPSLEETPTIVPELKDLNVSATPSPMVNQPGLTPETPVGVSNAPIDPNAQANGFSAGNPYAQGVPNVPSMQGNGYVQNSQPLPNVYAQVTPNYPSNMQSNPYAQNVQPNVSNISNNPYAQGFPSNPYVQSVPNMQNYPYAQNIQPNPYAQNVQPNSPSMPANPYAQNVQPSNPSMPVNPYAQNVQPSNPSMPANPYAQNVQPNVSGMQGNIYMQNPLPNLQSGQVNPYAQNIQPMQQSVYLNNSAPADSGAVGLNSLYLATTPQPVQGSVYLPPNSVTLVEQKAKQSTGSSSGNLMQSRLNSLLHDDADVDDKEEAKRLSKEKKKRSLFGNRG